MAQRARVVSRGVLRTLAALVLVDGRVLSAEELARCAFPWIASRETVWVHWIPLLRRLGCQIETMPPPKYGYRLTAVPPDALLDDLLVMVDQLKSEWPLRLWDLFGREPVRQRRVA